MQAFNSWCIGAMLFRVLALFLLTVLFAILWESPTARQQLINELNRIRLRINENGSMLETWQIISLSAGGTIIVYQIIQYFFCARDSLWKTTKRSFFRCVRRMPFIGSRIKRELDAAKAHFEKELLKSSPQSVSRSTLPEEGLGYEAIQKELEGMETLENFEWKKGKVSGCAYNCSEEITKLANAVYSRYCWSNPMHVGVFPEIRKMEAEVVSWCVKLFNGGPEACGTMTSGGTESILMAMRAYRELAYARGIEYPEIVGSTATHVAFVKAANYFCMKFVPVACDPLSRKVNLKKMRNAITSNTIVLVGNAPQYPYGVIDPIEDIGKIALKYKLCCHVDCCLGGFILPFMEKAGFPIEPFDFRVKGVTSISADTHKYGYSPKGSSVIMYANAELRNYQFFVATDAEMGLYASPTIAGSRPGGIIAATWATMMFMGVKGYVENTRKIVETTRWLAKEINQIPGLHVVGTPLACGLGFTSNNFNIYRLNSAMTKKGWELNPLQFPPGLHISVTVLHTKDGVAQAFVTDIRKCVEEIMANPDEKISASVAFYGTSQAVPDRSIITDSALLFLKVYYMTHPSKRN